jgi:hypothetical protein
MPRASAWEWTRTVVLGVNIAWTTLSLGGFLPGSRAVMIALTAVLVAVHFCDPNKQAPAHPAGWLFLPFVLYAACNVLWVTPVQWLGWTDWINWAQAIAVFWIVLNAITSAQCRRCLIGVLALLGVTSALMGAYQHFVDPKWLMLGRTQVLQFIGRSTGTFGIPNSQGVFMALLLPPAAALSFSRARSGATHVAAFAVTLVLAAGFVLAVSRGAWLALALAVTLRALFMPGRSIAARVGWAAAAACAAAGALLLFYISFPIMHVRMGQFVADAGERSRPIMWRGAWGIFREHSLWGGGAGCFNTLFEGFRPEGFLGEPVYAHCDYLNTLCDYGVVGFVLFFGAAATVLWRIAGARGFSGAAFTGLLAFALHLSVDFHLKIPALAMIVAAIAALITSEAWQVAAPPHSPRSWEKILGVGISLVVLVGAFSWMVPRYSAEEIRRAAREKIDKMANSGTDVKSQRDVLAKVRSAFARSVEIDPTNPQSWSDEAYADSLWALVAPDETHALGIAAANDASRAVSIAPVVAEFWIREGAGLDMQGKWSEGGTCSSNALILAPFRADIWYYRAYHLSLNPVESGSALAAANVSLRLDPGFLLAQALRQRLGHG